MKITPFKAIGKEEEPDIPDWAEKILNNIYQAIKNHEQALTGKIDDNNLDEDIKMLALDNNVSQRVQISLYALPKHCWVTYADETVSAFQWEPVSLTEIIVMATFATAAKGKVRILVRS